MQDYTISRGEGRGLAPPPLGIKKRRFERMRNVNAEVRNRAEGVAEHEAWRAAYAEGLKVRGAVEALNDVYINDYAQGKTPLQTVEAFVKKVGIRLATVTFASLVNYHRSDGRIGGTAKEWAEGVKNAWDAESAGKLGIHTTIHKACFDQIVRAFIKWTEEDKARRVEARRAKRRAAVEAEAAKAEAERAEKAEARGEDAETDEEILEIRGNANMRHLGKFVERDNEDYQGFKVRSIAFQTEMRAAEALQVMQEKEDAGEALRVAREALQEVFDKLHAISDIGD